MRRSNSPIHLIAFAFALAFTVPVLGQETNRTSQSQRASETIQTSSITDGQKLKVEGIVTKRNADTFTLRGSNGADTVVVLTDKTSVKTVRKGWFRPDRTSGVSYILRGLRLKAEGKADADGHLVAEKIRFDEQDLRTAQALESRVDPVETLANSTEATAESNKQRIGVAEARLEESEQNARRLAGQVDELSSVANAANAAAQNAQTTADQALSDANTANQRINRLDDYEVFAIVMVNFKSGSARLSPQAKIAIDEAATGVQNANLNGWIVAVVGYADSTGRRARNRSLSERRANAVINYLVTKHKLPMRRLIQPFGYGSLDPLLDNETALGRAVNRRAEIRVLVNKGISPEAGADQTTSENRFSSEP